jgi:hypothetical protein
MASGARPAGPLTRPHGTTFSNQGEEWAISKRQHPRDPNGYTRRCSRATVGDSRKGPLNNQGKPTKNTKHGLTHEPKAHARHDHDPGGPRSLPGWHDGRPLGWGSPRSRVRRPHEQNPPRWKAQPPPPRVRSASLEGSMPPRARSATLKGSTPPRRGPPRSRAPARMSSPLLPPCMGI